jgi:hypothetical protein
LNRASAAGALFAVAAACSGGGGGHPAGGGPCPGSAPTAGSACDVPRVQCEFGYDPRRQCRTFSVCLGTTAGAGAPATWRIQRNSCDALPAVQCPATLAAAPDQPCAPRDAWCSYPEGGRCHCTDCRFTATGYLCAGAPTWSCERPLSAPGCPAFVPRIGSACTGGATCSYGCEWGNVICEGGVWQPGSEACPTPA